MIFAEKRQRKQKRCIRKDASSLVRLTGLEPVRLPTRPSNVRVCLFRHSRILRTEALNSDDYISFDPECQQKFLIFFDSFLIEPKKSRLNSN